MVPPTHKTGWNLFPFWKAAVTVWPQTGCLSAQGFPAAPLYMHTSAKQAAEPGRRHRDQGRVELGMASPSSQKDSVSYSPQKAYLPPKLPPAPLSDLPRSRRPCTQPGSQPRNLKLLHVMGRNHHAPKPGHPFWRNTTIHGASKTAS